MKLALLVLLAAAHLPAATLLPGSWIELTHHGEHGEYYLEDEAGFFLGGELIFPNTQVGGDPDVNGMVNPHLYAVGFDVYVSEISSPWSVYEFESWGGAGYAEFEIFAASFLMTDLSGPFTFEGFVEDAWGERYEFAGQGTVYLRIASGSANDFVSGARYEFEAVATVPEPSTWGLLLLGLLAAKWAGKKRWQRASRGAAQQLPL